MRKVQRFSEKYVEIFPTLCKQPRTAFRLSRVQWQRTSGLPPAVFATGRMKTSAGSRFTCRHRSPAIGRSCSLLTPMAESFQLSIWDRRIFAVLERHVRRSGHRGPKLIGPLLKRYPGFNVGTPNRICDQALPPVNWLTLLGPELLAKVGGTPNCGRHSRTRRSRSPPWAWSTDSGRANPLNWAIEIGGDDLPMYRMVGSYLSAHRARSRGRIGRTDPGSIGEVACAVRFLTRSAARSRSRPCWPMAIWNRRRWLTLC